MLLHNTSISSLSLEKLKLDGGIVHTVSNNGIICVRQVGLYLLQA